MVLLPSLNGLGLIKVGPLVSVEQTTVVMGKCLHPVVQVLLQRGKLPRLVTSPALLQELAFQVEGLAAM